MKTNPIFLSVVFVLALVMGCSDSKTTRTDTVAQVTDEADAGILVRYETEEGDCGYKSADGKIVLKAGMFDMCFTDTVTYSAVVLKPDEGFVGIDKKGKVLYKIFVFDNGPDDISDGMFRILKDDKIGYADAQGKVVIEPQFSCAYPFEKGKARVSLNCQHIKDGEHTRWESSEWFYVDKNGLKIETK